MTIRIAHLTSVHPPTDVRIYDKECCSLFLAGYETVVVGPGKAIDDDSRPKIISVPCISSRIGRIAWTVPCVLFEALRSGAALFHLHDPELIPVGLVLKAFNKKVIFDCHENIVEDMHDKLYLNRAGRLLFVSCMWSLRVLADNCFDGIVAATKGIASKFKNKNTITVKNYPEWQSFERRRTTIEDFRERDPVVAYVGSITSDRGICEIVAAMEVLNRTSKVTLALAGRFETPEIEAKVRSMDGWKHVDYRGSISRAQIEELLSSTVCGLIILRPTANYLNSNPTKLYEYLAVGVPAVMSDFPLWREMLSSYDVARFVDPADREDIARNIQWILDNRDDAWRMGQRGQDAVSARFNWSSQSTTLIALYERIVSFGWKRGERVVKPGQGTTNSQGPGEL